MATICQGLRKPDMQNITGGFLVGLLSLKHKKHAIFTPYQLTKPLALP
ncbi:hypothetical protein [Aequorivita xiaoshiensis]|uniref:Uncharacterized protein n=1 Tax=Aequorivita xiaoshiensis TaxID=2874476 RepID=A0A9X1R2K3_9FLAO|nr:hypothetical protein [Aequorivita xiaoshiensis]MCG2431560.1 hypothetical protein [Aequorivita xiaoshiensis]